VHTNTNLGIVLLLAPLFRAALQPGPGGLRQRLKHVLHDLDQEDARLVYRAIRLARPGGLGRVGRQDVRRPPTATLRDCMRLAADRDAVAREYATGYDATWRVGLPALGRARAGGLSIEQAVVAAGLALLAEFPDTLIARRHGIAAARTVSREAQAVLAAGGPATPAGRALADRLDRRLRSPRRRWNPGATADLVTASLFVWLLERASRMAKPGKERDADRAGT
jgi:triphosphoribosyl-dephospho-CoA synthase